MSEDRVKVRGKEMNCFDGERLHTLERYTMEGHGELWADITGLAKKKSVELVPLYRKERGMYRLVHFQRVSIYRKEQKERRAKS